MTKTVFLSILLYVWLQVEIPGLSMILYKLTGNVTEVRNQSQMSFWGSNKIKIKYVQQPMLFSKEKLSELFSRAVEIDRHFR